MLSAQGLVKRYGDLTVVNGVSMELAQGEIVSIIGQSGAGKSSLLHLLGGLDVPDSGRVLIDGEDVFAQPARKLARFRNQKIGFVFQFHHLLPEFTALENVCIPLWIKGTDRKQASAEAREMLAVTGLEHRSHHKPSELSGGEQQRVAIARALVNKPAVLMADEPTGNLDSANAAHIHELFLDLRHRLGQTIIMITHNEALAALTDRTLVMKDGKIVAQRQNLAAGNP